MRIEVGSLIYDDEDKECLCFLSSTQGSSYAFVQCLDVDFSGGRSVKRYWGKYTHNPEVDIKAILKNGGKWPCLPEQPNNYES